MSVKKMLVLVILAVCFNACSESDDEGATSQSAEERGPIGKADSVGSCENTSCSGKASGGNCYCDNQCDKVGDCCSDYRAVCRGENPYDSCAGKSCGDSCKICAPGDADCFETAVVKQCDASGQCVPAEVECGGAYKPCAGKSCGDSCKICAPDDADCFETAVVKQCDASGQCVPADVECGGAYDSCAGKSCGDACTICAPGDADCFETAVMKQCDANGQCDVGEASC